MQRVIPSINCDLDRWIARAMCEMRERLARRGPADGGIARVLRDTGKWAREGCGTHQRPCWNLRCHWLPHSGPRGGEHAVRGGGTGLERFGTGLEAGQRGQGA